MKRGLLILVVLFVLAGCIATPDGLGTPVLPDASPMVQATMKLKEEDLPAITQTMASPTPAHATEITGQAARPQYRLQAALNYASKILVAAEEITYTNRSDMPLDRLALVADSASHPGVFTLDKLEWAGGQRVEGAVWEGTTLWIPLPNPLQPGGQVQLTLQFTLNIPPVAAPLGSSRSMITLMDWYPYVPPLDNQGVWRTASSNVVGEHLAYDQSDIHLKLYLSNPEPLQVIGAGMMSFSGNLAEFDLPAGRTLPLAVSDSMQIITSEHNGVKVTGMVLPSHLDAGRAAVNATLSAVQVFSEMFGQYPRSQLFLVEVGFSDGMESDGLYFLGSEYFISYDNTPANYLTAIAVHETAHQWWFARVGNDPDTAAWLDESLCTYSEVLWYEEVNPDLVGWWWRNRVWWYAPQGFVGAPAHTYDTFRPYVNAAYLRGASFLDALRLTLGDDAFFYFLDRYGSDMSGKIAKSEDFWRILATISPSANWEGLKLDYFGE
jgi:hypothetical protein